MMSYGRAVYPAQALSTTFPSWPTRQSSRQSSQSSPEQKALSVTSWHVTWPVLRIFAHVCSYLDFGVAEELSDFSCIACGIYIYNEMLQPDCNNLPNALPGTLHCRWICPGKEGNTCEPPVIDSWKSKSMSSTSCTWFANVKFAVMSMAYYGLPCAWNPVQVLGSANPSDKVW